MIRTDHKSLLHLNEQSIHTKIQQKALLKLMDLDYSIQYKKALTMMLLIPYLEDQFLF